MNPGGGSGWDEAPLDIQIPDDARELDRDVLAYHREVRARRRRNRLRRLAGPFSGRATVMPLLASILAVCLVAGAMLSVATFSPATAPAERPTSSPSSLGWHRLGWHRLGWHRLGWHLLGQFARVPGQPFGQPVPLLQTGRDQAQPGWLQLPLNRSRLFWRPASTPDAGTATISSYKE
ncbi:MAG: hypothetical protein ABSB59_18415 [Streptosporangiaceae bacterium]